MYILVPIIRSALKKKRTKIDEIKKDLLAYCRLDTLAMVRYGRGCVRFYDIIET